MHASLYARSERHDNAALLSVMHNSSANCGTTWAETYICRKPLSETVSPAWCRAVVIRPRQSTAAGGCCIWPHGLIWLIYWTVRFTSTSVVCVRIRRQFTGVVAGENQWVDHHATHRSGTLDWSRDHRVFADLIAESGQPYKRTDGPHAHSWASLIPAFDFLTADCFLVLVWSVCCAVYSDTQPMLIFRVTW